MRFFIRMSFMVLLMGIVAACGSSPSSTTPTNPTSAPDTSNAGTEPTPTREGAGVELNTEDGVTGDPASEFGLQPDFEGTGFVAHVDGAVTREMAGEGYFACENGAYALRPFASGLEQVTLILPADIAPGTYTLGSIGTSDAAAMLSLEDNRVFAGGVSGSLVLHLVANAPGQNIAGTYEFVANNGSDIVSVTGDFEFVSSASVPYCE